MYKSVNRVSKKPLALASNSPRRRELMAAFESPVEVIAPTSEEPPPHKGEIPEDFVVRLSLAKAKEVAMRGGGTIVLGADTAVVFDDEILGKPANAEEAARMLHRLRGRHHRVVTGVTALDSDSGLWFGSTKSTDVTMRRYSDEEVKAYVASGELFDKAGGYAIQDSSFHPVKGITGCYLNVVGLPLCEVTTLVAQHGETGLIRYDWRPPKECRNCPLMPATEASLP